MKGAVSSDDPLDALLGIDGVALNGEIIGLGFQDKRVCGQ
jgi:hypothetical protein